MVVQQPPCIKKSNNHLTTANSEYEMYKEHESNMKQLSRKPSHSEWLPWISEKFLRSSIMLFLTVQVLLQPATKELAK